MMRSIRPCVLAGLSILLSAVLAACAGMTDRSSGGPGTAAAPARAAEKDSRVEAPAPPSGDRLPQETAEKPVASAAPPPPAAKPLSPECEGLRTEVRKLDAAIPVVFDVLPRPAEEIHRDMLACIALGRRFLDECAGTEPVLEVKGILSRILLARHMRYREELESQGVPADEVKRKHQAHLEEILVMAREAARAPAGSLTRRTGMKVTFDALDKLTLFKDCHEEMSQASKALLEEFPDFDQRPIVHVSVAQNLINQRKYAEAVKYLDEVIAKHSKDPEFVMYFAALFDALTGVGDLERMEELMHIARAEFPGRMGTVVNEVLRGQYEQWYLISTFWLGFIRMAHGDVAGAREFFKQNITEVTEHEAKLRAAGKAVQNNVPIITRDFRSVDLLHFLDTFHGKVPEADFDLGGMWATDSRLTLRESRGKVVAAVFRQPGNRRAATFLKAIDELVKEREKDGLAGVTASFLAGLPSAAEDARMLQAMRDDLKALDVTLPAGFDPDREKHRLFRSVHATLGTASFVAFNRKGEIAWFLADARDLDRAITERVLDRLLAEK